MPPSPASSARPPSVRSAEQISRTVDEYRDFRSAERQAILSAHLAAMEKVRAERPEWYVWATEGQPRLTAGEYDAAKAKRPPRARAGTP